MHPSWGEDTQVFIVRVWRERREAMGVPHRWRGVMEHVPSGERQYIDDLDAIAVVIERYLGTYRRSGLLARLYRVVYREFARKG